MQKLLNKNRIIYLDILRIISILSVCFIHTSLWYIENDSRRGIDYYDLCRSMLWWAVPVFVMISGALLLNRPISIKQLFGKRILRLLIALIFWSSVYTVIIHGFSSPISFLANVLDGFGHSWFIYMIIGLYLIIPILNEIIQSEKTTKYFLALSFIFVFILPRSIEVYMSVTNMNAGIISDKINMMYMFLPLGYSGYFVLGYYLSKKTINRRREILIITVSAFIFLCVSFSYMVNSGNNAFRKTFTMGYLTPTVLAESTAIFVVLKKHCVVNNSKIKQILAYVSDCAFGIYLIHILIMNFLLNTLKLTDYIGKSVISMVLISIATFLLSLLLSALIKKIPIVNKYIV